MDCVIPDVHVFITVTGCTVCLQGGFAISDEMCVLLAVCLQGGFAISDEMCVNYVHYYPKTRLEVCKSSVTTKSLYGFFHFLKK